MTRQRLLWTTFAALSVMAAAALQTSPDAKQVINLPSSKLLREPVPGSPRQLNSLPTVVALSPDRHYLAILNNGYGTAESNGDQSIAMLDLRTNQLTDFPDDRFKADAHQTYFLGLAFSSDGRELYASVGSGSDATGRDEGDTGNGVAVYDTSGGRLTPKRFIAIPPQRVAPAKRITAVAKLAGDVVIPFPAGLTLLPPSSRDGSRDELLVANDASDNVVRVDAASGRILQRFDVSVGKRIPSAFPYAVAATTDGSKAYCSLWNASRVAELDLRSGSVRRFISLLPGAQRVDAGSHPTALAISPDGTRLYVALTNRDRVAVIDTRTGSVRGYLSTELPDERYGGTSPEALAFSNDGKRLFVADATADAVAVFDTAQNLNADSAAKADGFIPTEWYPTALAVTGDDLLIAAGKGRGTGPNGGPAATSSRGHHEHPYIASLLHGSISRASWKDLQQNLAALTDEVAESNRMRERREPMRFGVGGNPIHHVVYIIKENRTYDQIFGDLKPGDADPSLVMYGEDVTPNEHKLARQFGILDNFYDSGEVSGDGHVWSMAAITSDYNEKTWEISYRGHERSYDYEGEVLEGIPLQEGQPDIDEPGTGFIWANVARHGLSYRNYGEFVATKWCGRDHEHISPRAGTPRAAAPCSKEYVRKGEPLQTALGRFDGPPSPWPWPIPVIRQDVATKSELRDHFDPNFADFEVDYPDQLRADEFLREFAGFVTARNSSGSNQLPQFVILRIPDDHTGGTRPGRPRPAASIADNDLAVGRVVEAVSNSPYWDDTAIFVLEDDAQDGADHVDAHRSIALVISKYAPAATYVDHNFYTTVSMVATMEAILGLPPMNNNDAQAPLMLMPFSGNGSQPPFRADTRNRDNGFIYTANGAQAPGAEQSAAMDFSHADHANAAELNAILWRDARGDAPLPRPQHEFRTLR